MLKVYCLSQLVCVRVRFGFCFLGYIPSGRMSMSQHINILKNDIETPNRFSLLLGNLLRKKTSWILARQVLPGSCLATVITAVQYHFIMVSLIPRVSPLHPYVGPGCPSGASNLGEQEATLSLGGGWGMFIPSPAPALAPCLLGQNISLSWFLRSSPFLFPLFSGLSRSELLDASTFLQVPQDSPKCRKGEFKNSGREYEERVYTPDQINFLQETFP